MTRDRPLQEQFDTIEQQDSTDRLGMLIFFVLTGADYFTRGWMG